MFSPDSCVRYHLREKMRIAKIILLLALFSILGLALFDQGTAANANSSGSCTIHGFEADVRSGPTAGMQLSGTLTLVANGNGALTGSLLSDDRQVYVTLKGEVNGYALNLAFDLGYSGRTQTYIFGTGTLQHPFPDCSGATGGLLVGPQTGDNGVWNVVGS